MTLIVVVDDRREFSPARPEAEVVYLRSCDEALTYLNRTHDQGTAIDELWLDHDLGDGRDIPPVVRQLLEWAFYETPLQIGVTFVHTANGAKAGQMEADLRQAGYTVRRIQASQHGLIDEQPWT